MQSRVVVVVCAFRDPEKGLIAEQLRHPTTYVDGTLGREMAKLHQQAAQPVDCPLDRR
jgi:hypothetical protein